MHSETSVTGNEESERRKYCPKNSPFRYQNNNWVYKSNMYIALDVLKLLSKCCGWVFWLLTTSKTNCLLALKLSYTGFVWSGWKRAEFLFTLNKLAYSEKWLLIRVVKSNGNVLMCVSTTIAVLFFLSLHRYFLEERMRKPRSSWG